MPCGTCLFCAAGRGNACPEQQMPGNDIDGGFATHMLARAGTLVSLAAFPGSYELWKLAPVADALYRIPARKKLWMNWRWNSTNPSRSGAEVISVAAQMTDQSMP